MSEPHPVVVIVRPKSQEILADFDGMLEMHLKYGNIVVLLPVGLQDLHESDVENITSQLRKMVNHE